MIIRDAIFLFFVNTLLRGVLEKDEYLSDLIGGRDDYDHSYVIETAIKDRRSCTISIHKWPTAIVGKIILTCTKLLIRITYRSALTIDFPLFWPIYFLITRNDGRYSV